MVIDVETELLEVLKANVELPEKVGIDTCFEEMGLNSMNYIKIIVAVESKFGFEFDDDDLDYSIFKTPHDLSEYIKEHLPQ